MNDDIEMGFDAEVGAATLVPFTHLLPGHFILSFRSLRVGLRKVVRKEVVGGRKGEKK